MESKSLESESLSRNIDTAILQIITLINDNFSEILSTDIEKVGSGEFNNYIKIKLKNNNLSLLVEINPSLHTSRHIYNGSDPIPFDNRKYLRSIIRISLLEMEESGLKETDFNFSDEDEDRDEDEDEDKKEGEDKKYDNPEKINNIKTIISEHIKIEDNKKIKYLKYKLKYLILKNIHS